MVCLDCFTPPALRSLVIFATPLLPLGPLPLVLLPNHASEKLPESFQNLPLGSFWELLNGFWKLPDSFVSFWKLFGKGRKADQPPSSGTEAPEPPRPLSHRGP